MAKTAGENSPTLTDAGAEETPLFVTMTFTVAVVPFGTRFHGTTALIWLDCKNSRGASELALPLTNFTVTPPRLVESGIGSAPAGAAGSCVPKNENSEPGAIAWPCTKLAPFTIPPTLG